eukprot:Plantae.Rhodophyta-Purpureofilum_apyrenoidigerum.ctg35624.p1 GENE.Plantae.Rhodophyta-Purpureofilum_apyrenoidigerum.ctg35624~~Plantae.Rhodophyta-Purpureofilum_apyrenoidigerum.ctg35624.p1  ORF type:complete len:111 (-),score=21.91 Plantae.Rhodophyta-Purpureofilum_apyrenoidigerum.ctg35624:190-522(-)
MFKKGKFYEMYDRDADIGAKVLNLNYTGGGRVDMRCVGVPEQAFVKHIVRLAEAGYKVSAHCGASFTYRTSSYRNLVRRWDVLSKQKPQTRPKRETRAEEVEHRFASGLS